MSEDVVCRCGGEMEEGEVAGRWRTQWFPKGEAGRSIATRRGGLRLIVYRCKECSRLEFYAMDESTPCHEQK